MQDSDFQLILEEIVRALGRFRKLAYCVDPNATNEKPLSTKTTGIQVMKTRGVDFLSRLLKRLEDEDLVPSPRFLRFLNREWGRILKLHFELNQNENGAVASAMYQDGLFHALGDVLAQASLGTKSEDYQRYLGERERDLGQMIRKRDIVEIAYVSGWCEIYRRFCQRAETPIPPYFHPNRFVPTSRYVKG
jgi:hypothetical protein